MTKLIRQRSQGSSCRVGALFLCLVWCAACGDSTSESNNVNQSDAATAAVCGNGEVEVGEECDDGAQNSDSRADACRTDCRQAFCGDSVVDSAEECDEGPSNSDVAPDACRRDCTLPGCGDGVVDADEECDHGADNSDTERDTCRTTCLWAHCGDGVLDSREICLNLGGVIQVTKESMYVLPLAHIDGDPLLDYVATPGKGVVEIQTQDGSVVFRADPVLYHGEQDLILAGDFDGDGDGDVVMGGLVLENLVQGGGPDLRAGRAAEIHYSNNTFALVARHGADRYLVIGNDEGVRLHATDGQGLPREVLAEDLAVAPWSIDQAYAIPDLTGESIDEWVICQAYGDCHILWLGLAGGTPTLTVESLGSIHSLAPLSLAAGEVGLVGCDDSSTSTPNLVYLLWNDNLQVFEPVDPVPAALSALHLNSSGCERVDVPKGGGQQPDLLMVRYDEWPLLYSYNGATTSYEPGASLVLGPIAPNNDRAALTKLADFDGDDLTDVAVLVSGEVRLAHQLPGNTFEYTVLAQGVSTSPPHVLDTADLDGDTFPDLLIVNSDDDSFDMVLQRGGAALPAAERLASRGGFGWLQLDDATGDGLPDAVTLLYRFVGVHPNRSSALLAPERLVGPAASDDYVVEPRLGLVADVTGDGVDDLVVQQSGRLLVFSDLQSGRFASVQATPVTVALSQLKAADLDGDGRLDLYGAAPGGFTGGDPEAVAHVLFNDPAAPGSFTNHRIFDLDLTIFDVVAVDLDGDGLRDLVTANGTGGTLSVYPSLGGDADTLSFAAPTIYYSGETALTLTAADWDQDGLVDVVAGSPFSYGGAVILWGLPGGALDASEPFPYLGSIFQVRMIDLDGDGDLDISSSRLLLAAFSGVTTALRNEP